MKLEELEKLVALKNAGTITDVEYEAAKQKILNGEATPVAETSNKRSAQTVMAVVGGVLLLLVIIGVAANSDGPGQQNELVDGLVGRWRGLDAGGELEFTGSSYSVISPNGATTATWKFTTIEIYGNCTRVRPHHFSAVQQGQAPVYTAISNPGPGDDMDFCLTSDKRMLEMQPAVGNNRILWRRVD